MALRLFVDTYTQEIWRLPTRAPVLRFSFQRGATEAIDVQAVTDGVTAALGGTPTLSFKTAPTDAAFLIPTVTGTASGTGTASKHTFRPTFLSSALDTLLGSALSAPAYMWIDWTEGGYPNVVGPLLCRIYGNGNRGGETVPGTASLYTALAPSAAASVAVVNGGALSIVAGAGSGAYTYVVYLQTSGVLAGALTDISLELPASANPTIEVRNATAGGTLLHTISGDANGARYQNVTFRFDGTAWRKWSSSDIV